MKSLVKHYLLFFIVAIVVIALDQWTKYLVRLHVPQGGVWLPQGWENLETYARVVHWYNTGAAFGMMKDFGGFFTVLAIIIAALIIVFYSQMKGESFFLRLALSMQFSGAIGNLIDRFLFDGRVTDWISIGNFAVFNIADASITVGTGIMLLQLWSADVRKRESEKRNQAEAESVPDNVGNDERIEGQEDAV